MTLLPRDPLIKAIIMSMTAMTVGAFTLIGAYQLSLHFDPPTPLAQLSSALAQNHQPGFRSCLKVAIHTYHTLNDEGLKSCESAYPTYDRTSEFGRKQLALSDKSADFRKQLESV